MNGLREVHANKLLHLDIKPANIFIAMENGRPVLLDFGAARITLSEEAMKLKPMYTAGFAAPEHYRFTPEELGPWSDIYSVGATIYTCIAGTPPQAGDAREEKDRMIPLRTLARQHYSERPLRHRRLVPRRRPPEAPADRVRPAEAPHGRAAARGEAKHPRHDQHAAVEALLALGAGDALHHLPGQPPRRPRGQRGPRRLLVQPRRAAHGRSPTAWAATWAARSPPRSR